MTTTTDRKRELDNEHRRAVRAGRKDATTPRLLADILAAEATDGWQVTVADGWHDGTSAWTADRHPDVAGTVHVRFERDAVVVVLNVSTPAGDWAERSAYRGCQVEGHTVADGRCFTRFGVDTSSCDLVAAPEQRYGDHAYGDLPALLAGEYARGVAAIERRKTLVPVPGLPFNVPPAWFAETSAKLADGKAVRLHPHGFGTGYMLSTRRGQFSKRAASELEAKVGTVPVFIDQFDAD